LNTSKPRLDKFEQPDFIARLRAGDETAYHEVVEELAMWFAVYTKRKFGINEEDAKDIIQDAIMTVYLKIELYQPARGKFVQWAFQILRNKCSESYIMQIMQLKTLGTFCSLKSRVLVKLRAEIQQTN